MNRSTVFTMLCFLAFAGCKEEKKMPLFEDDTVPPKPQAIQVENTPGGAKISYTLPKDPNLLYVRADFETQGQQRNSISTYYNNFVQLEGYGDTLPHDVKLYSVSRSEVRSEFATVTIQPKVPNVTTAFRSLQIKEDFGGVRVWYQNPEAANIVITIMHIDSTERWTTDQVLYTKQREGTFAARRLQSKATNFGVYVKDRWGNYSDTLTIQLTPIFEREFDKSKFKSILMTSDNRTTYSANTSIIKLWDGLTTGTDHFYHTATGSGVPCTFSFDLAVTSKLSRFRYNQRYDNATVIWGHGNPRIFEIYGRQDAPPDTSWNGWNKLMEVTSVKPSGLPVGQTTPEDMALVAAGEDFDFPPNLPPVRYLRIKVLETWNKQNFIHIGELTFWGQ